MMMAAVKVAASPPPTTRTGAMAGGGMPAMAQCAIKKNVSSVCRFCTESYGAFALAMPQKIPAFFCSLEIALRSAETATRADLTFLA